MSIVAPGIPDTAPFSQAQRNWLNGYIASLQGGQSTAAPAGQEKKRVAVIYASQSGNTEELAESFGERLQNSGFDAPVICAEDYNSHDLAKENTFLMLSSTWGEGDPPDNAVEFWESISSEDHPRLEQAQFAVLGLGDSNYIDFCGMGKKLDARFSELGATAVLPRCDCDTDYEEIAESWIQQVLEQVGATNESAPTTAPDALETYSKKNPFPAQLLTNRQLNAADSARDTRHFEISLAGSGLEYQVGDVVGICPENDPALVTDILSILKLEATPEQQQILIAERDVCTISAKLVDQWLEHCEADYDISEDAIKTYCDDHQLIDLATDFPAKFESPDQLIEILRKLGPRLYSISSSPKAHPEEVHLTIARVEYELHDRSRKGVCSTYLSDRVGEDDRVKIFHQTVKHFKLPADLSTPVIMVGPGTGIAPFRAFLEEREASQSPGSNWLFFGNPHESTDYFYQGQLEGWVANGTLSKLDTAWSRDQETKVYVQDRIRENGEELWNWLDKDKAHFYVCGDAKRMAKDVDQALQDLIANFGNLSPEAASDYIAVMKKEKRYQRDVY